MSILHVENLTKSYADRTLFRDVSFEIRPGERVGLIGVNGCGKSTLMRILMGKESFDSGSFGMRQGAKLSYVEQIPKLDANTDLYSFTLEAFRPLLDLEAEDARILHRLEMNDPDRDRLIARQSVVLEALDRGGGSTFRAMTRSALLGLGFSEDDLSRPVTTFSGGQIGKAMLARAILEQADLLLLDEPTNNLDITAIQWLEDYFKLYKGAVLVVSHDRAFLDDTVTRMLELQNGYMRGTDGNYTRYMERKMNERELQKKIYLQKQKEIKRIEGIIAQQKQWNQAHNYVTIASKQKQIDRIKEDMVAPEKDEKAITFRFKTPSPTGNEVLVLKDLGKAYGKQRVFTHLNAMIWAGECVCLIGANGCGKTTLLKILTGEEQTTEGTFKIGAGVRLGYFAQNTDELNDSNTVIGELSDAFPFMDLNELRGALGRFLFKNDEIEKRIGTLSGGEKARIRLLKLVLSGANVLLLDEPTNHLDIASAEMLESAIETFDGTIIIVSHDRYLVRRLSDRVILMTENGLIEQTDETDDLFLRIFERKPEKRKTPQAENADNLYFKRRDVRLKVAKAKQEIHRIERLIEQNESNRIAAEHALEDAQRTNAYREMERLYETISALNAEENTLYEQLEAAEIAAQACETEDEQ